MNIDKVIFLSMRTWKIMFSWSWRCNKSDQRIRYCMGLHQIINSVICINEVKLLTSTSSQIAGSDCQSQNRRLTNIAIPPEWEIHPSFLLDFLDSSPEPNHTSGCKYSFLLKNTKKIIRRDLGSTFCDPIADLSSIKSRCLSNVETKSNGNIGKEHRIL